MVKHRIRYGDYKKVDMDEIASTISDQYNMSDEEFKYYMMKILTSDSNLGAEFNDIMVTAKLLYNDEAKLYTDNIIKQDESFRQQHELLQRMKFQEELLREQYSLKPQIIDRSITHQIKD